jgi:heptosyltransferase II
MAQSLFISLHAGQDCVIDVLAPAWSLPILERMPEVRRGIALPLGHGQFGLGTRWRMGRALSCEITINRSSCQTP